MRRLTALGSVLGFVLGLAIGPAFADDLSIGPVPAPFHAMAGLREGKEATPVPLTDEQLAAVEGMAFNVVSIVCVNGACTTQTNSSTPSAGVLQSNLQSILQSNAVVVKILKVPKGSRPVPILLPLRVPMM